MGVISKVRNKGQKAVYWARKTTLGLPSSDTYGKPQFNAPIELSVRWDDKTERVVGANSEEVLSVAQVMVDRDVSNGLLKKGTLASLTSHDPQDNTNVFEVQAMQITPNFKNTETLYVAYL